MNLVLRRVLGTIAIAGGLYLLYAALWVVSAVVGSQLKASGWSIGGSSTILNHQWGGNEIYLLILLYLSVGAALVASDLLAWRRTRR